MSTTSSLVDRLAALPKLAAVPRDQIEWLASHGELRRYKKGQVMFPTGQSSPDTAIVLAGRFSITVVTGGISRRILVWNQGDLSGHLPYSRMTKVPGNVVAEEDVEQLAILDRDEREMTRECYEFTKLCVHEMLDRARVFKAVDSQSEKLQSLGRLSAGLAHELNNPSSAVARSAKELAEWRRQLALASRELGAACLMGDQLAAVRSLEDALAGTPAADQRSPLARADREDAIADWLDAHDLDTSLAEALSDSAVTVADLDQSAARLSHGALPLAIRFIAADVTAQRLTGEIEMAASRIHTLVAAVKSYTRMDRAPVLEPVDLREMLTQLLTLYRAKARGKSATIEIEVDPDLPQVQGFVGELNQVWSNLLENALDAVPDGGHVLIRAVRAGEAVDVSVIDNGPGVPDAIRERIFEPFFTTKGPGVGSGMGLDIVLGILHRHHGVIEFTSKPGHTEFRVRLPQAAPTTPRA